MAVDLQAFRVAAVTAMQRSSTLATLETGGVLRRTLLQTPGAATCTITPALWAEPSAVSYVGSLFVASGIRSVCKVR